MMIRQKRLLIAALTALCSVSLVLTACGSPGKGSSVSADAGNPVAGGGGRIIQLSEPRTLDPAAMSNSYGTHAPLGNALYGTLMVNDAESLEIKYTMAEDFSTTDGGNTFTLKLRPGLQFSDGTPLDATAVKFNWDRLADPALGSITMKYANQITESEVIDSTTLKSTMATPIPHYAQSIPLSSMNWIASPASLQKGQAAFDGAPIGAGPFTLANWTRQNAIELTKNPGYWDAPKPYLDTLTIRASNDTNQRFNTLSTGGADLIAVTSWETLAKAQDSGFPTVILPVGGGQLFTMNTRRAPFNDERARRAVALAVDLDAMNVAVLNGKAPLTETLFPESSPFHADIPLNKTDPEEAQKLFDELATEGKPVSFTFKTTQNTDAKAAAESLQAQLSVFDNVTAKIVILDSAANLALYGTHDFDMTLTAVNILDPEPELWLSFHTDSEGNTSGIDDQQLNDALDAGRIAETTADRNSAYQIVQERLVALNPAIWYTPSAPSQISGKNVHGVLLYGNGSLLPEELWITK